MEYRQMLDLKAPLGLDRPALAARPAPEPTWNSSAQILSRSPDSSRDIFFSRGRSRQPLYSVEERRRRDETKWTLVQGILAPVQFVIFAVSLALVIRTLATGEGYALATASIVIKTLALYAIMVTGCIWEKVVFGRYLFAPAFYWEDVFSMLVLALHTAYLAALATGALGAQELLLLALAAYATYVTNATQFLLKLRAARLDSRDQHDLTSEMVGSVR
jgi:3-vinyl bacteriochlorophyllide hydratase